MGWSSDVKTINEGLESNCKIPFAVPLGELSWGKQPCPRSHSFQRSPHPVTAQWREGMKSQPSSHQEHLCRSTAAGLLARLAGASVSPASQPSVFLCLILLLSPLFQQMLIPTASPNNILPVLLHLRVCFPRSLIYDGIPLGLQVVLEPWSQTHVQTHPLPLQTPLCLGTGTGTAARQQALSPGLAFCLAPSRKLSKRLLKQSVPRMAGCPGPPGRDKGMWSCAGTQLCAMMFNATNVQGKWEWRRSQSALCKALMNRAFPSSTG